MKKIAVLTSGGDAPGMNACIRAVVRAGIFNGFEVYGVKRGYNGLITDDMERLEMRSVSSIIQRGGTMLYSARCLEFKTPEGQAVAIENMKRRGIEGLIVIGGDGSFRGACAITNQCGIPTVGIPGTIDNDLAYTDFTLGFDTAANTVVSLINNIRDTMTSHSRMSVIEVMGRNCGDLALYSGIAGGAEVIIVPEVPVTAEEVISRIEASRSKGKVSCIIVIAEGVKDFEPKLEVIRERLHADMRVSVLGHIQRGGSPTMRDRLLASQFGTRAVELLMENKGSRAIGIRNDQIIDMDIIEAVEMPRKFNKELYEMAKILAM